MAQAMTIKQMMDAARTERIQCNGRYAFDSQQRSLAQALPPELNQISGAVVDAAVQVHKRLGPGLLEGVYEACLAYEIEKRMLRVRRQVTIPVK